MMIVPLVVGVAFVAAVMLTRLCCRPNSLLYILDQPNHRSLHVSPVPRSGGVAIALVGVSGVALMGAYLGAGEHTGPIAALALVLGIVSFIDDCRSLSVGVRFATHVGVAVALVYAGISLSAVQLPGVILWGAGLACSLLSVVFVVWMVNLYNFMDGMDGLAGGMAVIGLSTLGLLSLCAESMALAASAFIVASSAGGFLCYNFPPAKIFMGDCGSSVLGFLIAALSLWADSTGVVPLWVSVIIFSPFVADATYTLCRRSLAGEKVWTAHRSHVYQRLAQSGWSHFRVLIHAYVLMSLAAISAIFAMHASVGVQQAVMLGWLVFYITIALSVTKIVRVHHD